MNILIVTMDTCPGYRIDQILGTAFGTAVRSRNVLGNTLSRVSAFFGGKQGGAIRMINQTREDALANLSKNAEAMGANAVLAMRFDSGEFDSGQMKVMEEITAYGTAVRLTAL